MQEIQDEFDAHDTPIQIIGVNQFGYDSGNEGMTTGRSLPWLQDTEDVDAWALWNVQYRDVYVLDQEGALRYIYNLTEHNLQQHTHREHLQNVLEGLLD